MVCVLKKHVGVCGGKWLLHHVFDSGHDKNLVLAEIAVKYLIGVGDGWECKMFVEKVDILVD